MPYDSPDCSHPRQPQEREVAHPMSAVSQAPTSSRADRRRDRAPVRDVSPEQLQQEDDNHFRAAQLASFKSIGDLVRQGLK